MRIIARTFDYSRKLVHTAVVTKRGKIIRIRFVWLKFETVMAG